MTTDDSPAMGTLEDLLTLTPEPGGFAWTVPTGWAQGRSTFGGLLLAAMTSAARRSETDASRPLRTLTASLAGAVGPGPCRLEVAAVRRGSGMSTWRVALHQGGEHRIEATAVFGRARVADRAWSPPMPDGPAYQTPPPESGGVQLGPEFAIHYHYQPTAHMPFSGGTEAAAEGWLTPRVVARRDGVLEAVAAIDAWWPAGFAIETKPRPGATVVFMFEYFGTGDPVSGPFRYRARADAARDGFISEDRALWSSDGALVALNRQSFVLIA